MEASERLYDVRKALGVTQVELAERLGVSQGSISETERREDVFLSTLRGYIEALGGKLRVTAAFDEVEFPIILPPVGPSTAVRPDSALTKGRSNVTQARVR
jgi:transcriptional regulator with XRE-family HTH domain